VKRRLLCAVVAVWLLMGATGCWDQVDLEKRAIIMAMGIDPAERPEEINLTLQTIIPDKMTTAMRGGGSEQGSVVQVTTLSGKTVLEALRNYQLQSGTIPYLQHNSLLVIGENFARQGITPIIDFFVRNPRNTIRAWVLISKGTAQSILQWQSELRQIPSHHIADLVGLRHMIGSFTALDIHRFILALSSPTSPATAGIEIVPPQTGQPPQVRIFGTAVFKKDKLAGWLDSQETEGLLWIVNGKGPKLVVVKGPGPKSRNFVQENAKSQIKIKVGIKADRPVIQVEIKEEGNIGEMDGGVKLTAKDQIKTLEQKKARRIKRQIENCLEKCQKEFNSDIFGFGAEVERQYPKRWKKLQKNWDREFPLLQVKVTVKTKIRGVGIIDDPVNLK
jgi:spore germination protein KC